MVKVYIALQSGLEFSIREGSPTIEIQIYEIIVKKLHSPNSTNSEDPKIHCCTPSIQSRFSNMKYLLISKIKRGTEKVNIFFHPILKLLDETESKVNQIFFLTKI